MPASAIEQSLIGKFCLRSHLVVKTGLLISGGGEALDIGGLDKIVIRDPLTRQPYLPGSSIKGKLRSIMERSLEKPLNRHGGGGIYRYESDDLEDGYSKFDREDIPPIPFIGARTCPLSRVFGSTGKSCWLPKTTATSQGLDFNKDQTKNIRNVEHVEVKGRNSPARLIVRDCHLRSESAERLKQIDTGLYMTEWKSENGIDRITAAAHPRQIERVPAGAVFDFELIYTVENTAQAGEDMQNLAIALAILEDDALDGSGSRGYGKVRFEKFSFAYKDVKQYLRMVEGEPKDTIERPTPADTSELLNRFDEVKQLLPS